MAMRFKVSIQVMAVARETLQARSVSYFPAPRILGGVTIREVSKGRYLAEVVLPAEDHRTAARTALNSVERVLRVLAVSGDHFETELSTLQVDLITEAAPSSPQILRSTPRGRTFYPSGFGVIETTRTSLDFEASALASWESWPKYLESAMQVNYLATCSATDSVRFLLSAVALELLASKQGKSKALLPAVLRKQASKFVSEFEGLASSWGLDETQTKRLKDQLVMTHRQPAATRQEKYLASVGLPDYGEDELADWWRIRGRLAHGGTVNEDKLHRALSRIRSAVCQALRAEIATVAQRTATGEGGATRAQQPPK